MPHVRKVFAGTPLPAGQLGQVLFIHPYVGPAPWDAERRARALVRLDFGLYILDIAQGSMHQLASEQLAPCGSRAAVDDPVVDVTPDGQWLTCSTPPDDCSAVQNGAGRCVGGSIQVVPLASGGSPREVVPYTPGVQFWDATWSPDGLHLAASRWEDGTYSVLIFTSEQPYGAAQLSTVLSLPKGHGTQGLSWSDDGAYLAYADTVGGGRSGEVDVLSVSALLEGALTRGHDPVTISDASVRSLSAGSGYASGYIGWRPGKHAIALHDGSQVVQIDAATGTPTTVLSLPGDAAPLAAAAWLSDGSGILFAIGYAGNVECAGTRSDFYLYTPS